MLLAFINLTLLKGILENPDENKIQSTIVVGEEQGKLSLERHISWCSLSKTVFQSLSELVKGPKTNWEPFTQLKSMDTQEEVRGYDI